MTRLRAVGMASYVGSVAAAQAVEGRRVADPEYLDVELHWLPPVPYVRLAANNIPAGGRESLQKAGIYLWTQDGVWTEKPLYVGQTTMPGLWKRQRQHLQERTGIVGPGLQRWAEEGKRTRWWPALLRVPQKPPRVTYEAIYDSVERSLIWELDPPWNRAQRAKTVVQVSVRISNLGEIRKTFLVPKIIKLQRGEYLARP